MNTHGGPGNEPEEPGRTVSISQSVNADRIMAICFLVAAQKLLRFAVAPDSIKSDSPTARSRLEFLAKEILREVKNMPAQGASEADELAAKNTAIALLSQSISAVQNDPNL